LLPIEKPSNRCGELVARLARDDVDRAGDRVAPVQSALGSAENLDALDIQKLDIVRRDAGEINAIDLHGHARIAAGEHVIGADAANARNRPMSVCRIGKARRNLGDILDIDDAGRIEGLAAERRDGQGRFLHRRFAGSCRRHDQFIAGVVVLRE
jgi:hypothetical protein